MGQKPWQRRTCTCRHDIGPKTYNVFEPRAMDNRIAPHFEASRTSRLGQKDAFAGVGLDQMYMRHTEDCQHKAGEAGAATHVDQDLDLRRQEGPQLGRIQDVAAPQIFQALGRDQVDGFLPLDQDIGVAAEAFQCFT